MNGYGENNLRHITRSITLLLVFFVSTGIAYAGRTQTSSVLDEMIAHAGISRSGLKIPIPEYAGIRTQARLPIVNDVLDNPFYLPGYSQVSGAYMNGFRGSITPSGLVRVAREMMGCDLDDLDRPKHPDRSLLEVLEQMRVKAHRGLFPPNRRKDLDERIRRLPEGLADSLVILCEAFLDAVMLRKSALIGLTDEERKMILDQPMSFFEAAGDTGFVCGETQRKYVAIMRKVDIRKILFAGKILLDAVEETRPKLEWINSRVFSNTHEEILFSYDSPFGRIVVGGPGINRYEQDAAVIVDIGGSDCYLNNAGGSRYVSGGISCVIDVDGNDIYDSRRFGVQGSGVLGVGIVVDYDGTDSFAGGDLCQGSAFGGLGILYDERGSDKFLSTSVSQGAAAFGQGLLIDIHGNDFLTSDSMSQGFGTTMGIGACVNVFGKDNYLAGRDPAAKRPGGMSQGFASGFMPVSGDKMGLWGGIGFLVDGDGDDAYFSPGFSQGAAGFLSLGMLLDSDGDDIYDGRQFCQGAASEYGAGILVDQKGHDQYFGVQDAQAAASPHSVAFLLDYSGIDRYRITRGEGLGCARGEYSLALHLDYDGPDRYDCGLFCRGMTFPSEDIDRWSVGLFLNQRGEDQYLLDGRPVTLPGDNAQWSPVRGAEGVDTETPPALYFTGQEGDSRVQHYDMSPVLALEGRQQHSMLGAEDPFARFHALDSVVRKGRAALPVIVKAMQRGHNEFRRVLTEGILLILDESATVQNDLAVLTPLLNNIDPETRKWVIRTFCRYSYGDAGQDIAERLKDSEPDVRKSAIIAVRKLRILSAVDQVRKIVRDDPDALCRREALETLDAMQNIREEDCFLAALRDPAPGVFQTAAKIVARRGDRRAVGILQLQAAADDLFHRRQAGEALVLLKEKSGYPVLIDTLKSCGNLSKRTLPCTRTVRFLEEYTGALPGQDIEAWQRWWIESEIGIDPGRLIDARNAYDDLLNRVHSLSPATLLKSLETLRKQYAEYHGYDKQLAEPVHDAAASCLEQGRPKRALNLAAICLDMEASPADHAIYAEALYATGDLDHALAEINLAIAGDTKNEEYRKIRQVFDNAINKGEGHGK